MIESALFFVLGFLAALLLTLLAAPAYRRRIARLTQRRIEATVPLTREEILAEKDRLRAEHAMEIRRIELAAKALKERNAVQLVELGRAQTALAQGADERMRDGLALADSQRRVLELNEALLRGQARVAELERGIGALENAGKGPAADAIERQPGHSLPPSDDARIKIEAQQAEIERLDAEASALRDEKERWTRRESAIARDGQEEELQALRDQLDEALLLSSNRQIDLVAAETEIERLRGELAETARRPTKGESGIEASALSGSPAQGDASPVGDLTDDRVLREQLAALAADVVALTAALEGPASPIHEIIGNAPTGSSENPSLADRIRSLQRKSFG